MLNVFLVNSIKRVGCIIIVDCPNNDVGRSACGIEHWEHVYLVYDKKLSPYWTKLKT